MKGIDKYMNIIIYHNFGIKIGFLVPFKKPPIVMVSVSRIEIDLSS